MDQQPTISIFGSNSLGGGAAAEPGLAAIGRDYNELLVENPAFFNQIKDRNLVIGAGDLSSASDAQIGRLVDGTIVTAAMVTANQTFLAALATYCRTNNVSITVQANLDNTPAKDWTYQWLIPAAKAGLPITQVEGVDEVEIGTPAADFSEAAQIETAIVKQVCAIYPDVRLGQWTASVPASLTAEWWDELNATEQKAGLPAISYAVADTAWNAPWQNSQVAWSTWLSSLSDLTQQRSMQLSVLIDGIAADTTGLEWTAQSEQHAALLAQTGIAVDDLRIQSWQDVFPHDLFPFNSPTSLLNDASVIEALYPSYQSHRIDEAGSAVIVGPDQIVLTDDGSQQPIGLSIAVSDADVQSTLAVIVTTENALITSDSVAGSVSGLGGHRLMFIGTDGQVNKALATLTVSSATPHLDAVDVEVFGVNGRLASTQVVLTVTAPSVAVSEVMINSAPISGARPGRTIILRNAEGLIVSQAVEYKLQTAATGFGGSNNTVAFHEPTAEPDVSYAGGVFRSPEGQPTPNGARSLPIGETYFNALAYDPTRVVVTDDVVSTEQDFSLSGKLEQVISTLAPIHPLGTSFNSVSCDFLPQGGLQVTIENTGSNPAWNVNWNPMLASVTTIYGSNGQKLDEVFQGGPGDPEFSLENVYDPLTGRLWEQIQATPPPAGYEGFVTGPKVVTQFNTGDNPNWDGNDWGSNPSVSVVWQDYYVKAVLLDPGFGIGDTVTRAYDFSKAPPASNSGIRFSDSRAVSTSITNRSREGNPTIGNTGRLDNGTVDGLIDVGNVAKLSITGSGNSVETFGFATSISADAGNNIGIFGPSAGARLGDNTSLDVYYPNAMISIGKSSVAFVEGSNSTISSANQTCVEILGSDDTSIENGKDGLTEIFGARDRVTFGAGSNDQTVKFRSESSGSVLDLRQVLTSIKADTRLDLLKQLTLQPDLNGLVLTIPQSGWVLHIEGCGTIPDMASLSSKLLVN